MAGAFPVRPASGESLFARYAYPPNELGHCGPPGPEAMLQAGGTRGHVSTVRERAPRFQGAWAYLRLIAASAGVPDPLQADVVSAYWLGSDLLEAVPVEALESVVRAEFATQPGVRERLEWIARLGSSGPSHAFHVFVVYPWVGLLRSGSDVPRSVLDSCRVRWGTVESMDGEQASVRARPLTWDGAELGLGAERLELCRWTRGRDAFVQELAVGDVVSMHWDWVCDRLDAHEVVELDTRTRRQLAATNAWLARG